MGLRSATEIIEYRGWTVEVQRKAFRRRISLRLRPGEPLLVQAARLTSLSFICEFIESRREWIESHLHRFVEQDRELPPRGWIFGASYPLLGEDLVLRLSPTPLKKAFVSHDERFLNLHWPLGTAFAENSSTQKIKQQLLRTYFRQQGEKILTSKTQQWAEQMQLRPQSLKFSAAQTRWGSCNSKGRLMLNWRLIVFRPEILDSVVVHELAHLKHLNHSAEFWNLVHQHLPAEPQLSKELRESQRLVEFLSEKG